MERHFETARLSTVNHFKYRTYCSIIRSVKLTIGLKLNPTKEQALALKETLERANTDDLNDSWQKEHGGGLWI